MESKFSAGVFVGIVISVIAMNIICNSDESKTTVSKPSAGTYNAGYHHYYDDDNYDSYESYGLHERGMH